MLHLRGRDNQRREADRVRDNEAAAVIETFYTDLQLNESSGVDLNVQLVGLCRKLQRREHKHYTEMVRPCITMSQEIRAEKGYIKSLSSKSRSMRKRRPRKYTETLHSKWRKTFAARYNYLGQKSCPRGTRLWK